MNFAEFVRTPFFYRTPPVAASNGGELIYGVRMILGGF